MCSPCPVCRKLWAGWHPNRKLNVVHDAWFITEHPARRSNLRRTPYCDWIFLLSTHRINRYLRDDNFTDSQPCTLIFGKEISKLSRLPLRTLAAMGHIGRSLSIEQLDDYSGYRVVVTSIIFLVLTSVFLGLRFYAKRLMRSRSGWDDLLLVGAYLCNTGLCVVYIGR